MTRAAVGLAILLTASGACSGKSSPAAPQPVPITDLTGVWTGSASDSSGPGAITWTLTKSSTGASGEAITRTTFGSVVLTGTVVLTLSGTSANWTVDIPVGGVLGQPACTVRVTGTATVSTTTITGVYSGTGSCTPPFSNGTVSLSKP